MIKSLEAIIKKMRMLRKIVLFGIIITILIIGYNYVYQDHRDIAKEEAKFELNSKEIKNEFVSNVFTAEEKYLNRTIEVSGTISETNIVDITIDDNVFCQFSNNINSSVNLNSIITIKGRVIGYDDLLEQVKLDQCILIKKE